MESNILPLNVWICCHFCYKLLFVINKLLFYKSMIEAQMMLFTVLAVENPCKAHLLIGKVAVLLWLMEKAVLRYSYSHSQQQEVNYGNLLALHFILFVVCFQKAFFFSLEVVSRQPVLIHATYWPENNAGQMLLDLVPDKCSPKEWLWI